MSEKGAGRGKTRRPGVFGALFRRQKLVPARLAKYGFVPVDEPGGAGTGKEKAAEMATAWHYETDIFGGQFRLHVTIDPKGNADTALIETETGEEYTLYKTHAAGTYVGEVRGAIEEVLRDIVAGCYEPSVFKTRQAEMLIAYMREKYGDNLEFLWPKFPDNGIWRRQDTGKWYCAMLTTGKDRFGFDSEEIVELIDLRTPPEKMADLLAKDGYYPGWHMNKKHWFTILLDEGVPDEDIKKLVDASYELATKKSSGK